MDGLSSSQRELVALGAAIASNCVPCIEFHIPAARAAGLSDRQIGAAIQLADKVRQVPAQKVVQTATALIEEMDHQEESECCAPSAAPNCCPASSETGHDSETT